LDTQQLEAALATQRRTFQPLGRILRDANGLAAETLAGALRQQTHTPRIYLRFFPTTVETRSLLDMDFCLQHEVIAFEKLGRMLCVAFSKPLQNSLIKQIEATTEAEVKAYQAPWEDIAKQLKIK